MKRYDTTTGAEIDPWKRIAAIEADKERMRGALEGIANSVALVLTAKAVPTSMRDGMKAIENEARAALAASKGDK